MAIMHPAESVKAGYLVPFMAVEFVYRYRGPCLLIALNS